MFLVNVALMNMFFKNVQKRVLKSHLIHNPLKLVAHSYLEKYMSRFKDNRQLFLKPIEDVYNNSSLRMSEVLQQAQLYFNKNLDQDWFSSKPTEETQVARDLLFDCHKACFLVRFTRANHIERTLASRGVSKLSVGRKALMIKD